MAAIQQLLASYKPAAASNGLLTNLISVHESNEASGDMLDAFAGLTSTESSAIGVVGTNTGLIYPTVRELVPASAQYFYRADDANFSLGTDTAFAWEVWVYFNSRSNGQILVNKGPVTGTGDEYLIWLVGSGPYNIECYVGNGTSNKNVTSSVSISASTWYQVILDHDPAADQIAVTVNGTRDTAAWAGGTQDTSNRTAFGSSSIGGNYLDARIGPIRFWKNRILDSTARSTLYNSGAGLPYSSFS